MNNIKIFFYALIDPRTEKIRYIGRTNNIKYRFTKHIYYAKKNTFPNSHKDNWIRILLSEGLKPKMKVIDEIINEGDLYITREIELIAKYKNEGCDLTNMDKGGTGWEFGNQIAKGNHHTEEHKKYMSELHKGKNNPMYGKPSPLTGKKFTDEHRKKLSAAKKDFVPWNKGKTGLQVAWNKGLKQNKIRNEKCI